MKYEGESSPHEKAVSCSTCGLTQETETSGEERAAYAKEKDLNPSDGLWGKRGMLIKDPLTHGIAEPTLQDAQRSRRKVKRQMRRREYENTGAGKSNENGCAGGLERSN